MVEGFISIKSAGAYKVASYTCPTCKKVLTARSRGYGWTKMTLLSVIKRHKCVDEVAKADKAINKALDKVERDPFDDGTLKALDEAITSAPKRRRV